MYISKKEARAQAKIVNREREMEARMTKLALCLLVGLWMVGMWGSASYGVEQAPRISDREIIEALAELKAGQQALHQRFEQVDKRFEQVDKRFEQVDKRFEELRGDMNARFEQVDKRLDQMISLFIGIIATFAGIVVGTIGFAVWDRRSALRPALERSDALSVREERIERVLREYAREDPRLAQILESAGVR